MNTDAIRSAFLDFFAERGHRIVPPSSLVPANDPTLLFTNAGMVQFKDALTGRERLDYRRAVTCQRCVRAGGKHNDLENVGYTGRHQTLFEMLGNFSFGDYFKRDAIRWAWAFVTEVLKLDPERLWITVHPTDDEARDIWENAIGVPRERVVAHADNFWAMGDTGPCGPDSELFYDLGPGIAGGPPGSADEDGDRFSEFWNLVFPQFDRGRDGTLEPLPKPGVDTGMGLERIAAIVQGGASNYDSDLIRKLVAAVGRRAGISGKALRTTPSLRVIADHARAATFLIADGVLPGNEDRGYVLRRIIRRGLRHGHKLDIPGPFFHELVDAVVGTMGAAYPELAAKAKAIGAVLAAEEDRFGQTLRNGMALLDAAVADLDGGAIPGELAFKLYDTYGFPADLTADIARERNLEFDRDGFDAAMAAQRSRARAAARFDAGAAQSIRVEGEAAFTGYEGVEGDARIVALFSLSGADDATPAQSLDAGSEGIAVLDATPFYAEAGGQIGDRGELTSGSAAFAVADTARGGSQHLHRGRVERGVLRVGDAVHARVDAARRGDIARNHSATHLLHAALRRILGGHVEQKGSLVAARRLRFDFSHPQPPTRDELARIEALVNARIRENSAVVTEQMTRAEAQRKGALALFGEKYADQVRVLSMGDGFSVELCGGTHVRRTGDIGVLRIVAEEGIAAGVRRIEAVAGRHALDWLAEGERRLAAIAELVRGQRDDAVEKVRRLAEQAKAQEKTIASLRASLAASQGADLAAKAVDVHGVRVLAATVDGDAKALASTMDNLRDRLGNAVVVLAHAGTRISLVAGVSAGATDRISAAELVQFVGAQVGARGGGRAHMAKAGGGNRPDLLDQALGTVADWVRARTGSD